MTRKITGKSEENHSGIVCDFWRISDEYMEKNSSKAPYNYSASFGRVFFSISLWEKPQTLHFHDFWIPGRVHDSQNQLFLSLETRIPQIIQEKSRIIFKALVVKSQNVGNQSI